MGKIIAIDLGTTNSVVSVMEAGQPTIILNQEGMRSTPSVVACSRSGEWLVGEAAKRQAITNPDQTIFMIKRLMGREYDEVVDETNALPYMPVEGSTGDILVDINGQKQSPAALAAMILAKLKDAAEAQLGHKVTDAVIAVPACFDQVQRQATKEAGKIADLRVARLINAPSAAATAYQHEGKAATLAIYDFGGGTFDCSIVQVGDGVVEVVSTSGDTRLGGGDIDRRVTDWIVSEFKKQKGVDLSKDAMAIQWLKEATEKAKVELSTRLEAEIDLPFAGADPAGSKHIGLTLARSGFERMCEDIFQRSVRPCQQALRDAGIRADKIDAVLMAGGSTRIPRLQAIAKHLFNSEFLSELSPEAVAVGAAIQAGVLSGDVKDVLLLDVTPLSYGIETSGGAFFVMIDRNTTIPERTRETFSTGADNQTSVEIKVFQGERARAMDNRLLRVFSLTGIPPAPRGVPQIEVTFDIDANDILNVTAVDRGVGSVRADRLCLPSGGLKHADLPDRRMP